MSVGAAVAMAVAVVGQGRAGHGHSCVRLVTAATSPRQNVQAGTRVLSVNAPGFDVTIASHIHWVDQRVARTSGH